MHTIHGTMKPGNPSAELSADTSLMSVSPDGTEMCAVATVFSELSPGRDRKSREWTEKVAHRGDFKVARLLHFIKS